MAKTSNSENLIIRQLNIGIRSISDAVRGEIDRKRNRIRASEREREFQKETEKKRQQERVKRRALALIQIPSLPAVPYCLQKLFLFEILDRQDAEVLRPQTKGFRLKSN